jgi:hypothetical protein
MAILLSITGGNMMDASTWGVVQPTSFQGTPTVALSFTPLTSQYTGTTFVLVSAVTISGVALQLSGRVNTPTGTLNVQLYDVTGATIIAQVTINISDLPNSNVVGNNHIDWTYFKFASNVTTIAGRTYAIRCQASVASQLSWYYTNASANVNKALVTTTTQAPVTGDALIIAGNYTSAGVNATTTVIMNDNGTIITSSIWISSNGIFKYITNAPYTISLQAQGYIVVGVGGTFNIGTLSDPITQVNAYVILLMVCTTALQYTILLYGTFTTYGKARTISSKLSGDVVPLQTTCTTATLTDWKSGDNILVPSTTRTYTQYEVINLNSATTGTTLSFGGFGYAHGGNATTMVQADMVNITRNIVVTSNLNTARSNIQIFTNAKVSCYYTFFQDIGTGVTIANSGICVNALTSGIGLFDFQGNVVTGSPGLTTGANCGMFTTNGTGTTISNNIFYAIGWTTITPALNIHTLNDGNYIIGCLTSSSNITCQIMGSNNVMTSNSGWNSVANFFNNATNNSFYSNASYGLYLNMTGLTTNGNIPVNTGMNNFKIWRNNTNGILQNSSGGINKTSITSFDNIYVFGNLSTNINNGGRTWNKLLFTNSYFYGGSTLVAPNTIGFGNPNVPQDAIYFDNCYFGYSDSNLTPSPHSVSNIQLATGHSINFNNCYFNSTEVTFTTSVSNANIQTSQMSTNHNGVTGSNKYWNSAGTITTDTLIYNTVSPSLRLIPVSATWKLPTTTTKVAVKVGQTCSVSVKVRKSITADGTVYNGTAPRLVYCFNPILGNMLENIGDATINLLSQPQNFESGVWAKTRLSITPGATAAPDGTITAAKIVEDATISNFHVVLQSTGVLKVGDVINISVYAKAGERNYFAIQGNENVVNFPTVYFNLTTGVATIASGFSSASMLSVGNGWWRCSCIRTIVSAGNFFCGYYPSNSVPSTNYLGDGVSGFYLWGAQSTMGSNLLPYYDNGQWETLSYTTPAVTNDGIVEFYVDCDGTTGWINVDDWSTTTYNDTRGTNYWGNSSVYIEADYKVPSTSYTFIN